MARWSPQRFRRDAEAQEADPKVVQAALDRARHIQSVNSDIYPILTLRHLSHQSQTDYRVLRAIVARSFRQPYRVFRINKQPLDAKNRRFRIIAVPLGDLFVVQRWITQRILKHVRPHAASTAFSKGDTLMKAAELHSGAKWIIKLDVQNFFESINEISAYRVFHSLGYSALVSFELTRICTRLGALTTYRRRPRFSPSHRRWEILNYSNTRMGHLPQGAPTSPMLANLAVRELDEELEQIAEAHGMYYTRYADDITLSTSSPTATKAVCVRLIGKVYACMAQHGLSPNITKTKILHPGARKVVLGLGVNTPKPLLTREFKLLMRQHLYYLVTKGVSPAEHASRRKFASVTGMKNHLYGLAMYAKQIEPQRGQRYLADLDEIVWPR